MVEELRMNHVAVTFNARDSLQDKVVQVTIYQRTRALYIAATIAS